MRRGLALILGLAALALAACGGSTSSSTPPPAAKLVHVDGRAPSVVLTPLGAQRIGIRTTAVAAVAHKRGATTVIPYSAVVYEANGKPVVFLKTGRLTYTGTPIAIAKWMRRFRCVRSTWMIPSKAQLKLSRIEGTRPGTRGAVTLRSSS